MKKTKKKASHLKIIVTVLCCIVAAILLILAGARCYFRLPVAEYYSNSEKSFIIPGLSDGMIVQGLAYNSNTEEFLVTGYRIDGNASQLSIVDKTTEKEIKRLNLSTEAGEPFTSHVGGLSIYGNNVYIAADDGIAVFSYESIANAENGASVKSEITFSTSTENDTLGVAFVHVEGNSLYLGEFYRDQNYSTLDSHKYKTEAGDNNTALIIEYPLSEDAKYGLGESPEIARAFSVTDLVQGMCFDDDGRFYLSTSYGPAFSHIYVYDVSDAEGEITVLEQTVPLYVLDSSNMCLDIKAPPMSEEIVITDGKLYTMCESATDKYIFGKFTSAKYCYATDVSEYFK